jgi:predicted dehydrogenase
VHKISSIRATFHVFTTTSLSYFEHDAFKYILNRGITMGILGSETPENKIRFAVVGLGYISQIAVLPAFGHAKSRCELTALVSGDREKLDHLGEKYGVEHLATYDEYDDLLEKGVVDAVYIALPNSMHCDYTIRAAEAGVHVLCEKPMANTEGECRRMIAACEEHGVKLMVAYRLHFEEANMKAVEIIRSGALGDARLFSSLFSMQVREGDIRVERELGGGSLYDIGVYCINAARYLFQAEPSRVTALTPNLADPRFKEVEGLTGALLEFDHGKLGSFLCCFDAADVARFEVVGTKGSLVLEHAFEYTEDMVMTITMDGKTKEHSYSVRDQFAPQLLRFAECIQENREPEPSGLEGLADIRIIEAIYQSARAGTAVSIPRLERSSRPGMEQEMHISPVREPKLFHAKEPKRQ